MSRYRHGVSLLSNRSIQMSDAQIVSIITKGQGFMASHAPQIPLDDRWMVVRHLRFQQQQHKAGKREQQHDP